MACRIHNSSAIFYNNSKQLCIIGFNVRYLPLILLFINSFPVEFLSELMVMLTSFWGSQPLVTIHCTNVLSGSIRELIRLSRRFFSCLIFYILNLLHKYNFVVKSTLFTLMFFWLLLFKRNWHMVSFTVHTYYRYLLLLLYLWYMVLYSCYFNKNCTWQ